MRREDASTGVAAAIIIGLAAAGGWWVLPGPLSPPQSVTMPDGAPAAPVPTSEPPGRAAESTSPIIPSPLVELQPTPSSNDGRAVSRSSPGQEQPRDRSIASPTSAASPTPASSSALIPEAPSPIAPVPEPIVPSIPASAPVVDERRALPEAPAVARLEPLREPPSPVAPAIDPRTLNRSLDTPREMAAVQAVLDRYRQMYSQLDATAAVAIWPQADSRALERVFSRLQRQELDFDDCVIALSDASATAQCAGRLRYIPRVGSDEWRVEPHAWTIQLQRRDESWVIVRVNAR